MPLTRRNKTKEEKQFEDENDIPVIINPVSRQVTSARMQEILTNPFYIGKIIGNYGKLVQSNSHKPIVSEDLFYKVQLQLGKKNVTVKYATAIKYPLRGIVRCHVCKRVYTPYQKKGILYFSSRCISE